MQTSRKDTRIRTTTTQQGAHPCPLKKTKLSSKKFYQLIEENNYDALKDLCHPDFRFYSQIDHPLSADEFIRQEKNHMDACPGFTMRIHNMFAEGDKVACYLVYEGVHTRPFLGLPPTNKKRCVFP